MPTARLPTYFISHGGGPWPWLKKEMPGLYDRLEESLSAMPSEIGVIPRAVLMISAHWEAPKFKVMAHPQPPMIYDYGGFPEHTYHIHYNAPGAPEVAKRVLELIHAGGLDAELDRERGFDHGMYSPMVAIYPDAKVPVLQLSMKKGYDPETHIELGRAIAPLRDEGILIIGSGLSYHNLRVFGAAGKLPSSEFDRWLNETLSESDPRKRVEKLKAWSTAPSARAAHPREDHLIPLMVALGAAENDRAVRCYHETDFMGGLTVSSYRFQGG